MNFIKKQLLCTVSAFRRMNNVKLYLKSGS